MSAHIFLVAAEESGDRLGAALIAAIRRRTQGQAHFSGVGGAHMGAEGVPSLFPLGELGLIGFAGIPARLPKIFRRIRETADAIVSAKPDALVVIDSPEFTHRVARRVRARAPDIPIIDYVCPSVWAWRPGRARSMRAHIDHVLALLPFEPAVHQRLGGPPCTYVGHPLVEQVRNLRPNFEEARRRLAMPPTLLMLPGSRAGEIERLLGVFSDAVALVQERLGSLEVVVATVPHLVDPIHAAIARWPLRARIVVETAEKQAAFRIATAALAKSGTVTLELALAGVPMIAAYKVSAIEYLAVGRGILKRLPSIILTNLLLGENVVPELLQHNCTAEKLAAALLPLFNDTPDRRRQIEAFSRLDAIMEVGSSAPAVRAADIVLATAGRAVPSHQ